MTKAEIEKEIFDLNQQFWVALKMQDFDEVEVIQKQMKRLEALMRIEEDAEDIKPEPALPDSVMLNFLKRLKKN